jgi:hypothetical protein
MPKNPKQAKRKPLQMVINERVLGVLEDPDVMEYIIRKLIRRRPSFRVWRTKDKNTNQDMVYVISLPWWIWKICLWVVLAPGAKQTPKQNA